MFSRSTTLLTFVVVSAALVSVSGAADPKRGEHSLDQAIAMASSALDNVNQNIKGYRCQFVKAERVGDKMGKYSYMDMRVRHEPFAVFLKFVGPDENAGRQAIFVQGKNDDKLLVKEK